MTPKQTKVLELHAEGLTFKAIGDQLNVSKTAAFNLYKRAQESINAEQRADKFVNNLLDKQLRNYRKSEFTLTRQKPVKPKKGKVKRRVAFGDTHGASIDPKAWNTFLHDLAIIKPDEIIHGGDFLECDGFLAEHQTTHYVAQTETSFQDDIRAANMMFDQLQEVAPQAKITVLEGNHDRRIETWCVTQTKRHELDSAYLLSILGPAALCHFEERNIEYIKREQCYDGLRISGSVERDNIVFTHPESASKHHASKMVTDFSSSVCYFHTHRRDYSYQTSVHQGDEWGAWCPGCMCLTRKYFHHTNKYNHNQGYFLQTVFPSGLFTGRNIPILPQGSVLDL